jgi:serine/threonine-protein kinase HipA
MAKEKVSAARVLLWDMEIGAVAWDRGKGIASFQYTPKFAADGPEVSPLTMPRDTRIYSFPELERKTFYGLPGLLADSLPDRFGNALIDAWLVREGRDKNDFTPVERLCYVASRGMGALEYKPALRRSEKKSVALAVDEMVRLAQFVIDKRTDLLVSLYDGDHAVETIIKVGTSAGGARAKALVAWNRATNEIRSGQVPSPPGFEPWIMKFDGVNDKSLGTPAGYGRIEYSYHQMARQAGIRMSECRLFEEHNRAHFMTRRFDRNGAGGKIHMQSLCGIAHYDFNLPGAYSYEQALLIIQKLNLGYETLEEMYRRMVFNIVARNQDDHTKNIAFLMEKNGKWSLSPAFDVIWAYNPSGKWTGNHQMSVNGKRDHFTADDILRVAGTFGIKNGKRIISEVTDAVRLWPKFARDNNLPSRHISEIGKTHRLKLITP